MTPKEELTKLITEYFNVRTSFDKKMVRMQAYILNNFEKTNETGHLLEMMNQYSSLSTFTDLASLATMKNILDKLEL